MGAEVLLDQADSRLRLIRVLLDAGDRIGASNVATELYALIGSRLIRAINASQEAVRGFVGVAF